jgi:hypothetical protein
MNTVKYDRDITALLVIDPYYEYQVGPVGYIPTEGDTVTLPVGYDEQWFKQYVVTRRHFFYSGWQDNISTQHINIIVADA